VDIKEFWRQYEVADKEHKKWEKRADKVLERYRQETESGKGVESPSFNILWANTSVLQPSLFSQVPKPDITRRYKDDDQIGAHGSKVLERALDFVMDDGDFYDFGVRTVLDYLLPGMTVAKIRYCPTYSTVRKPVEVEARQIMGPEGEPPTFQYFKDDEKLDPAEVRYYEGTPFIEQEVEEVVDEHVEIERWPWKNFRHQKAKRWKDVGWCDYISYLDRSQLKTLFKGKAKDIELTVDGSGNEGEKDPGFKPTHAEVHEIWFARDRKVRVAVKGNNEKWFKEGGDPLRLDKFFPTPKPLLAVDTNDSLTPIPLFTLYQHQANELDLITKRISILMRALKLAGLYAGAEKDTLKKLFEADENQMIPVADWGAIKDSGGITGLVEWLPIEQVGKVLTALFREREAIVAQIFELTGIADIQRGSTDPRETKGSQVIKAQFASRRTLTPKQEVERYFRDVLRIAAEIMAEHFSTDTLERMTGLPVPPEVRQMLQDELQRQYRIDIETDSTVAPDEEREQANMAKALEAVTAYVQAIAPLAQQGLVDGRAAIQLLKVYLRKFRWGREIEETLEQIERNPPEKQPDPEEKKLQMEMQIEQQKAQLEQQKLMMEMQAKQQELAMKMQEMELKLQFEREKGQLDVQMKQQDAQMNQVSHAMELDHQQQSHEQALTEQKEMSNAKAMAVRQGNKGNDSGRAVAR
jgi:hypothetical protein